jgi:Flp pilus assembly protein TadB
MVWTFTVLTPVLALTQFLCVVAAQAVLAQLLVKNCYYSHRTVFVFELFAVADLMTRSVALRAGWI